ncbi:MAG: efflux RND transporter permease subunit [Rhodospirillaceae bacterium]
MKLGQFFADRPVFASVLSILLMVVGAISYLVLPVAQYPEVVPPTISVTAQYPGANADVVADTVAAPLEQEINGVENMLYMTSQSTSDGTVSITVTFELGTDLDEAQVLVQNRVSLAEPRLPEPVRRLGISTRKNSPNILMVVHMLSPDDSLDQLYIANYAFLQVKDRLARIDGVGNIQIFGGSEYAMRIWLDPERMAALDLTAGDVVAALHAQNVQVAGGALSQDPLEGSAALSAFQTSLQLKGRLISEEDFAEVVVKTGADGALTRLADIGRIELGAQDYVTRGYLSGQNAAVILINQQPGSNALDTAAAIQDTMAELSEQFPQGLAYDIVYNPTEYIAQSIDAVIDTIFEAVVLVVLVVLVFLQTWRASIIPIIAIPVSLIGSFAVMQAFGFSINTLTLFGLVLAIGIVVDDAIVVVENVERHVREGMKPLQAVYVTMSEVGGAVISTGLVLAAVFVPTAFLEGITGQFYRQFALTIAVATVISVLVSLTLSPALTALLIKPHSAKEKRDILQRGFDVFNAGFDRLSEGYATLVRWLAGPKMRWVVLLAYGGLIALTLFAFRAVPTGFIPPQDQGYLIVAVQLPAGSALNRTDAVIRKAEQMILEVEDVAATATFTGFSGATFTNATNAGAIFVTMPPFAERSRSAEEILGDIRGRMAAIEDAFIIAIPPPPVPGLGTGGGFKMFVQDRLGRGTAVLEQATWQLIGAAYQQPGLVGMFSPFQANTPQLFLEVDRTKAQMLGVPVSNVFETLEVFLGSSYVNDFNQFGRTYRVTAQADAPFRLTEDNITTLRTRNADGQMVPLGSLLSIQETAGPDRVPRFNLYRAAELQGSTLPGVSSGQAIATMEALAAEILPYGISYEWTDLAYQEKNQGDAALYIFPLCVLFVFLTLAALYESWSLPLAVILIVPMCLLSAIAGVMLRGMDNNILTQIGFVVLVGLASKNAILIVEFARDIEAKGRSAIDAAVEACHLRLRPILMTSFAFILGVVPLMIAQGAGAEMRQALGTAVFFGMLGVTVFGLLFTPVFYVTIRGLVRGRKAPATPEPEAA